MSLHLPDFVGAAGLGLIAEGRFEAGCTGGGVEDGTDTGVGATEMPTGIAEGTVAAVGGENVASGVGDGVADTLLGDVRVGTATGILVALTGDKVGGSLGESLGLVLGDALIDPEVGAEGAVPGVGGATFVGVPRVGTTSTGVGGTGNAFVGSVPIGDVVGASLGDALVIQLGWSWGTH